MQFAFAFFEGDYVVLVFKKLLQCFLLIVSKLAEVGLIVLWTTYHFSIYIEEDIEDPANVYVERAPLYPTTLILAPKLLKSVLQNLMVRWDCFGDSVNTDIRTFRRSGMLLTEANYNVVLYLLEDLFGSAHHNIDAHGWTFAFACMFRKKKLLSFVWLRPICDMMYVNVQSLKSLGWRFEVW